MLEGGVPQCPMGRPTGGGIAWSSDAPFLPWHLPLPSGIQIRSSMGWQPPGKAWDGGRLKDGVAGEIFGA